MTATLSIFRDGPDLLVGFAFDPLDPPAGFEAFGHTTAGGKVWVRCRRHDLTPLRAAVDFLADRSTDVAGLTSVAKERLGLVG